VLHTGIRLISRGFVTNTWLFLLRLISLDKPHISANMPYTRKLVELLASLQAFTLSPLLYMHYNADFLDIVQGKENTMSLGSDEEIVHRLDDILQETEN
jgi:hypothetical protein